MARETKQEKFRKALIEFHLSNKTASDYRMFLMTFHSCIRPDSGLVWDDVNNIIDEVAKLLYDPEQ